MIRRHIRDFIRKFHELLDAKDAPHSVAGGTSIGVFFGWWPATRAAKLSPIEALRS